MENSVSSVYPMLNLAMYKQSGNVVTPWDFIRWFLSQDFDSWSQVIECLTSAFVFFKQVSVLHGCKVLSLEQKQLQVYYFISLTVWWRKERPAPNFETQESCSTEICSTPETRSILSFQEFPAEAVITTVLYLPVVPIAWCWLVCYKLLEAWLLS